jgi:hypothetical protein
MVSSAPGRRDGLSVQNDGSRTLRSIYVTDPSESDRRMIIAIVIDGRDAQRVASVLDVDAVHDGQMREPGIVALTYGAQSPCSAPLVERG